MPNVTPGKARDQRRVGLERAREILLRVFAARAHLRQRRLVDIGGVARRIDVDVAAAGVGQALDDLALDRDHVGHERVHVLVDRLRILVLEALADAVRPDQRHLGGRLGDAVRRTCIPPAARCARARSRDFTGRRCEIAVPFSCSGISQRRSAEPPLDALRVGLHGAGGGVVALDRGAETVLEIEPAHLAVADDVEADAFLQLAPRRAPPRPRCARSSAASILPSSKRARACFTASGRSRLPTTSVRMVRRSLIGPSLRALPAALMHKLCLPRRPALRLCSMAPVERGHGGGWQ